MIVNQKTLHTLRLLSDLLLLNISFVLAASLAQSFELFLSKNVLFVLLAFENIVWYFSSRATGLYDDFATRLYSRTIILILKNSLVQLIFTTLFIFYSKELLFTRNFIIFYAVFLTALISIKHFIFQKLLKKSRLIGARNLVIVGTGETANKFKELIENNPHFGYKFIGYISPGNSEGTNVLGAFPNLDTLIKGKNLTDVVLALSSNEDVLIDEAIRICDRNAVKCFIIPDYLKFSSRKFSLSLFSDFPLITVRLSPLEEAQNRFIKRVFDILFTSIISILFLWWLIPIIALLIKLDSRGPVFFKQKRVGVLEKPIKVIKFRTMKVEKSKENEAIPVKEDDDRITRVGRVLRKLNLDEIPQFINVLKGDMSVVGPRPHNFAFNDKYREIVEEIKLRNRIKPGITGWAQIHGLRGDFEDEAIQKIRTRKRVEYDIWYIENWSLSLDLLIIFETFIQSITFRNRGT